MAEGNHSEPVVAERVANHWALVGAPAGAFVMQDGGAGISFVCPCGCGDRHDLTFADPSRPGRSYWWNGDQDAPTVRPYVRHDGACNYRGLLTRGAWVPAADSGEARASRTR